MRALLRAQDPDSLLQLNADMARDLIAAERCSIWLVDAEAQQLWTKIAHGVGQLRIPIGKGLVGACVGEGQPIVVNDTSSDTRFLNRIDSQSGYVTYSVLVVPMRGSEGGVIGALQALNKAGGFSDSDIQLLSLVSSYAANLIEAQRLRETAEQARCVLHELEIAREVQQELLPEVLPQVLSLDCAAFCRPASLVGGDYYDFLSLPDGRIAFTLGDVSGKGIAAAVMMASIQMALRAQLRTVDSPGKMLGEFNESVVASSSLDRYSTLICGKIDAATGVLTYVNAGHVPPMLLRRKDGILQVQRLRVGGYPIGLLERSEYSEGTVHLVSGDLLLCFSDGLSEAWNEGEEMWGEQAIASVLLQSDGLPAQEAIDKVVGACDAYVKGCTQSDDLTLIAVRVI